MRVKAECREIIPRKEGVYSSFPTFVVHGTDLYLYYRVAKKDPRQVHGFYGKIERLRFDVFEFLNEHLKGERFALERLGEKKEIFRGENELDAIVSKLEEDLYCLCTRVCVVGKVNQCFISFSNVPEFHERETVNVKGLMLSAFYGKAFKSKYGYVFPAYGILEKDSYQRPLLLVSDMKKWDILAILPTMINGSRLNECSVVFNQDRWHIFLREDDPPYGIWYADSKDLVNWSFPRKIIDRAHAPVAISHEGQIFVAYRQLVDDRLSAFKISKFFGTETALFLDAYPGSPYDGGYGDLGFLYGKLLAVYYFGNIEGEPLIKGCLLDF